LPRGDRAFVEDAKISRYLLDMSHAIGKAKAVWFRDVLGLVAGRDEQRLRDLLLHVAISGRVAGSRRNPMGTGDLVEVVGLVVAADGRKIPLSTTWEITDDDDTAPRLVTAYPG
jgi:hypothetical protein